MKRLLPVLLLMLMLAVLLLGCGEDINPPDQLPENPDVTEEVSEPFILHPEILVVRGEQADAVEKTAAAELRMGIMEKTGMNLKITTDWTKDENPELAEYEILVGRTIRDISTAQGLGMDDFIIRLIDGKKLVILGEKPNATQNAVNYFLDNCVDENGFTFEEIDMTYDASEELR